MAFEIWSLPWGRLLPLFLTVLFIVALLKLLEVLWWKPRRIEEHFLKQGIRGPPYRFFLGNLKEIIGFMVEASSKPMTPQRSHNILPRVLSFYHQWKKIYGPTFLLWFGPTPRLGVADPELIREIFISRAAFFDRNEFHPLVRQFEGEGLVSLHGDKWAHHRKVLAPTFHMDNLKLMIPTIGKTVVEMMEMWEKMAGENGSSEVEIDVSEWYQRITEDAITWLAFGLNYDDGKAVFGLQAKQMAFASEAFRMFFVPGYRFLPTKKNMSSWKLDNEIKRNLVQLITRRKEVEGSRATSSAATDLLGLMINASGNPGNIGYSPSPHTPQAITDKEIMEECKTFFFAGKHTTTNLMTWATILLAINPEWQERARQEVLKVCGSRGMPSREQLSRLKTLGMILNETLRLYPPVIATIRQAKTDVKLGACNIPQGTELLIPILAVHHDPFLWGMDAAQFNPNRFSNGTARAARHPFAFIPFGLGARMCIGQNLALLETKLTIALILRRFSFSISPFYVHAPTVLMLLYPQYGAPILFRPLPCYDCGHQFRHCEEFVELCES